MNVITQSIFNNREAAALPYLAESGGLPALVSGLSAVHRAQLAAALRQRLGQPMLIICPDDASAESMKRDVDSMTGESAILLCARELTFYKTVAASRQTEQQRLSALLALALGEAPIVIATAAALIQRSIPRGVLLSNVCEIDLDSTISPDELQRRLIAGGYCRSDQVEGAGQFARRGGILDFYSPADPDPVRIEFWGDDVDSMGRFDIGTQRRTETLDKCRILPAAETLISAANGGGEALAAQLEGFAAGLERKKGSEQALKLAATLRADAEKIANGVPLPDADRYMPFIYDEACAMDYVSVDTVVVFDQPVRCADRARSYIKQLSDDVSALARQGMIAVSAERFRIGWDELCAAIAEHPVYMADAFTLGRYPIEPKSICSIPAKQLPSYGGSMRTACDDVLLYTKQGFGVEVLAGDMRRAQLLQSFFKENGVLCRLSETAETLPKEGECHISTGALSAGYEYPGIRLAVISDTQLLRVKDRRKAKKHIDNRQRISSYADLSPGDFVVHDTHGIGRFAGIVKMKVDGCEKDYIKIAYAGSDVLYVPATQLDTVAKYLGAGEEKQIKLSKMGGTEWNRTKSRTKAAVKNLAKELIALYAERSRLPGYAFSPDTPWQREFEDNFGYTETDDQLRCIREIKADMESTVPMDRLLCGDVGYGKTEVALRAVMKCVLSGKQAAILVPTTVLAQQHYQTAVQRFFGFPVEISVLSRFRSPQQISKTLSDLQCGKCDIVIGTHRLLQKDVKFKDLGLLIVDEEQRFGVAHKEHIKEMSRGVDVLTLSATPIPRTLNMALSGMRDMSCIDEPPQDRLPVQTFVMEHDWGIVCDAINRELTRGGQVYYLHNRIENIERTAIKLQKMLSELYGESVTVGVAHGQMDKEQLASVMEDVEAGKISVLVCTTIIETGIDIPNVNTLIIEDADKMGLAQLHQIRGRVGRSSRKASAYLTFRPNKVLTEIAEKRLTAIREFAEFGSGFKIAMRDLEIRGAGNVLGAEQSGHLIDVGYDMYLRLLEEAVLEEKGEKPERRAECSADLAVSANIPESYIPSPEQRMDIYRRISLIRTEEEADDLTDELIDRFGDPPGGVNSLIHVALLRGEAGKAGIRDISQKSGTLRFIVDDFDMARVSWLYAKPEYKGRLKVEAGSKPCLSVKLAPKMRSIEEARRFAVAWRDSAAAVEKPC